MNTHTCTDTHVSMGVTSSVGFYMPKPFIWMDSTHAGPVPRPLDPSSPLGIGFHYHCLIRAVLYPAEQSELQKAEPLLCKHARQAHHQGGDKILFGYWPIFPCNLRSFRRFQGHRPWVPSSLCKRKDQLWLGNLGGATNLGFHCPPANTSTETAPGIQEKYYNALVQSSKTWPRQDPACILT